MANEPMIERIDQAAEILRTRGEAETFHTLRPFAHDVAEAVQDSGATVWCGVIWVDDPDYGPHAIILWHCPPNRERVFLAKEDSGEFALDLVRGTQ